MAILAAGAGQAQDLAFPNAALTDQPIATADANPGGGAGGKAAATTDQTAQTAQDAHGLLAVPIPLIDPQLGGGIIPVGAYFYKPVEGGRPWVSGIGGLYTSKKDWAVGVGQQADLLDGRLRLMAGVGYGRFSLDFFGTGVAAGASGRSITLDQTGFGYFFSGLYDVQGQGHLYVGLRSLGVRLGTSIASPLLPNGFPGLPPTLGLPPLPSLPKLEGLVLRTNDVLIGPAFEYDTRNSEFMPTKGTYLEGNWLFASKGIGSTFEYNKLVVAGNEYIGLDKDTVLALRAMLCHTGDGAPFYDLCLYGSQHDLRGYEGGRYRDHAMGAMQAEVRRHLFWRIGAVAFAGIGGVAPTFGDLFSTKPLPSAGVGLRFQPVAKIPVNMSVDYAWGADSQAIYLYLREAF